MLHATNSQKHLQRTPRQADQEPLCFFSVVRYVPDTIRNEPRNIGVVVVCPDEDFGGAEFNPGRSRLPTSSQQYAALSKVLQSYKVTLPGYHHTRQASLFTAIPSTWTRNDLEMLHRECTNAIQFTPPAAALGDPTGLLERLYWERVAPPQEGTKQAQARPTFSSKQIAQVLRKRLNSIGKQYRVEEDSLIEVRGHTYQFDLAVQNGHLVYAIETLSFQAIQSGKLRRAEEIGARYARIWPEVADATGAHGYLLVEPPTTEKPGEIATAAATLAHDEYQRVTGWVREAGIDVRGSDEIEAVTDEIATQLQGRLMG